MTVYGANGEIPQTILSERYKAWKVHIVWSHLYRH
jgi:hypothetical protein